jgi:hypothetical protein
VDREALRDGQLADLGLGHFAGVGTEGDVDVVGSGGILIQDLEQALGVEGAAGPGDSHDKFHGVSIGAKSVVTRHWVGKRVAFAFIA